MGLGAGWEGREGGGGAGGEADAGTGRDSGAGMGVGFPGRAQTQEVHWARQFKGWEWRPEGLLI